MMLKTYLYLTPKLDERIKRTAKLQKKSKAEVMRVALEQGLTDAKRESSAVAMLQLQKLGKKYKLVGPSDASLKFDEYLWDKNWGANG